MIANSIFEPAVENSAMIGIGEVSLLLPRWQLSALEQIAQDDGITIAQLLRRVVQQVVRNSTRSPD